jgi:hypothetical protein
MTDPEIPHSSAPADSLVKRVHSCIVGEPECGHMQARAVIREVAAWIEETQHDHWSAVSRILRFELDYPTPNPPPTKT